MKFEEDMNIESAKGKKTEILDLLKNYNKLCSEEFDKIKDNLREICGESDVDLIKIKLSETDENGSKTLQFKIEEIKRTASLFKINIDISEVIIPRTVEHGSVDYLITRTCGINDYIMKVKFVEDSVVDRFYRLAFPLLSFIEEIYFPSSL